MCHALGQRKTFGSSYVFLGCVRDQKSWVFDGKTAEGQTPLMLWCSFASS